MVVTGFLAYPAGFDFKLVCLYRKAPGPPDGWHEGRFGAARALSNRSDMLRLGIRFADGTKATNVGMRAGLRQRGGSAGGRRMIASLWYDALPPPGSMQFVCVWPKYGIPETEVSVEAQLLIEAAAHAVPIWDADVGLPEPKTSRPGQAGWSSYTASHAADPEA